MPNPLSADSLSDTKDTILLLNIFGVDRPGITARVSQILTGYRASILDIGQSIIHNHLNLGILISIPAGSDRRQLQNAIRQTVEAIDNDVKFQNVSREDYSGWVEQQGKARHIVTLLARQITAEHIASLTTIAVEHGLSFDHITRLTGRIPLHSLSSQTKSCVEFSARGNSKNLADLRAAFMELSHTFDIDIAVQEDSVFRRNRRLICFDMDSTLVEAEVINELAVEAGVGDQVAAITARAMEGEIDFNESFSRRLALLAGLDEGVLQKVAARLQLTEGAGRLFTIFNHLGYKTAILSGGFDYFARQLQKKLQVDYVYANHLDIRDGKLSGKVSGVIINGERKAGLLQEIADRENISLEQVIAVGDGANDLPMLSLAGLGIAFRAKPLVKTSAKQSISQLGLDAILYLMGLSDRDVAALGSLSLDE